MMTLNLILSVLTEYLRNPTVLGLLAIVVITILLIYRRYEKHRRPSLKGLLRGFKDDEKLAATRVLESDRFKYLLPLVKTLSEESKSEFVREVVKKQHQNDMLVTRIPLYIISLLVTISLALVFYYTPGKGNANKSISEESSTVEQDTIVQDTIVQDTVVPSIQVSTFNINLNQHADILKVAKSLNLKYVNKDDKPKYQITIGYDTSKIERMRNSNLYSFPINEPITISVNGLICYKIYDDNFGNNSLNDRADVHRDLVKKSIKIFLSNFNESYKKVLQCL